MVTLEEDKAYLRVASDYEDSLITSLLMSSETLCMDVARLGADEWSAISEYNDQSQNILTRG